MTDKSEYYAFVIIEEEDFQQNLPFVFYRCIDGLVV